MLRYLMKMLLVSFLPLTSTAHADSYPCELYGVSNYIFLRTLEQEASSGAYDNNDQKMTDDINDLAERANTVADTCKILFVSDDERENLRKFQQYYAEVKALDRAIQTNSVKALFSVGERLSGDRVLFRDFVFSGVDLLLSAVERDQLLLDRMLAYRELISYASVVSIMPIKCQSHAVNGCK